MRQLWVGRLAWTGMLIAALVAGCDDGGEGGGEVDAGGILRDVGPDPDATPEPDAAPPECVAGEVRDCEAAEGCAGIEPCVEGAFGPCEPPPELCNGEDDDCDGVADEGFDGLGSPCIVGMGVCAAEGRSVCSPEGDAVICEGAAGDPGEEICNDVDDDCDGATDEGLGLGNACWAGTGGCVVRGEQICGDDGGVICSAAQGPPGVETCNDLDDDCDGSTDEGFDLGAACTAGLGVCVAEGVLVCGPNGEAACDAAVGEPVEELCDGADDDCDGEIDEGFGVGDACQVGVGACVAEGRQVCAPDGQSVCDAEPSLPADELCNAVDDDCDGEVDEDFGVGDACMVGEGACAGPGVLACGPDGAAVCLGEGGGGDPEVCNGADDDCDGLIDEEIEAGGCVVDDPECPAPGEQVCVNGALECQPLGGGVGIDLGDGADGALIVAANEVVVLDQPSYDFTRLVVAAGGRLEVAPHDPAAEAGGMVEIKVQGDATVEAGGVIDLNGRGWPGAAPNPKVVRNYPGAWTNDGGSTGYHGLGPSAGQGGWAAPQQTVGAGGGGGHMTAGANGVLCGADGRANYSVFDVNTGLAIPIPNPPANFSRGGAAQADPPALSMGSGGGGGGNNYDGGANGVGGPGGAGGGAISLAAGRLTVAGQILANGAAGGLGAGGQYVGGGGGGAGGAIHLIGAQVVFSGEMSATGGAGGAGQNNSVGGAGGMGWIRISAGVREGAGVARPAAVDEQVVVCGDE